MERVHVPQWHDPTSPRCDVEARNRVVAPAARLTAMRRYFVIVLLTLLPFQFSWAAIASYCGHETLVGATHLGHHEHQHQEGVGFDGGLDTELSGTADDGVDGKAPGGTDLDCGHCHGYCSVLLIEPPPVPAAFSATTPKITHAEGGATHAPSQPDRPQWSSLA
jgi:hypothetical protein